MTSPNDEVLAYIAIDRLLRAYADLSTRRAYGELEAIAVPDAVFSFETFSGEVFEVRGTAAFAEFATKTAGGFTFFEYVNLNFVVAIGTDGTARGRAYNHEISYDPDKDEFVDFYGQYHDDYVTVDGQWRFARRRYKTVGRRTNDRMESVPFDVRAL